MSERSDDSIAGAGSVVEAPISVDDADAIEWDVAADVVVVGFGGAGAAAALEAKEQGADVLPLVVRGDRDEERAGHVKQWLRGKGLTLLKKPQDVEKGPDARRRPKAAREA